MVEQQGVQTRANSEQAADERRVKITELLDAEVHAHNERFRAATGVGSRDRVLDIGCGTGQSTREAARAAPFGSALGVDISAAVVERARQLSANEGLRNVTYQQADAEVHHFRSAHFDLCISRFGAMFFADPVAAFTNIGYSLHPGARLVLLAWQDHYRNEWSAAVRDALTAESAVHAAAVSAPHFSLADPTTAEGILAAAGFAEVDLTDVHEPVYYGPDSAAAYDFVLGLREPNELLAHLNAPMAERARKRLRATLAAHATDSGVFFDSRAWIITARRP